MDDQVITVSIEVFRNESELRQIIDLIEPRFLGSASNIGEYSKNFIRETWDRIKWREVFSFWYIHKGLSGKYDFNEFMDIIDPEREFRDNLILHY